MRQNKTDQAVAVLRELADMTESASARKLYGDALVQAKQHDDAIKLYDGILREDAKYYPALNGMGTRADRPSTSRASQLDDKQARRRGRRVEARASRSTRSSRACRR